MQLHLLIITYEFWGGSTQAPAGGLRDPQPAQPGKPNGWLTPPSNVFCSTGFTLGVKKLLFRKKLRKKRSF